MGISTLNVLTGLRGSMLGRNGMGPTDGELLDRFINQRDEAAFEGLVRRHGAMVLGVCNRILRNSADAEDALQTTFMVLARKGASVSPRSMVGNWLHGVAQKTALKAKKERTRIREKELEAGAWPKADPPPENLEQLRAILDEELKTLPANCRAAIILCDLEGKTAKEAARHLCRPAATIGIWRWRGRHLLASKFARRGLTLSSTAIATILAQNAVSASVSPSLLISTVKAASLFAAGQAAASVARAEVAALTEGVLKDMFLTKLKVASAMLSVVAVIVLGAFAFASGTQEQNDNPQAAPDVPAPAPVKKILLTGAKVMVTSETDKEPHGICFLKFLHAPTNSYPLNPIEKRAVELGGGVAWKKDQQISYEAKCKIEISDGDEFHFLFKVDGPAGGPDAGRRVPRWVGKAKVWLFLDGKETPELLGETESREWRNDIEQNFKSPGEHYALKTFTFYASKLGARK
jgi:RNA polymerase sigma factor (sigma-70 family)